MTKTMLMIIYMFILCSCEQINRSCAQWEGHSYECVDGVQYIQFPSGASVAYNKNGTIRSCKCFHGKVP